MDLSEEDCNWRQGRLATISRLVPAYVSRSTASDSSSPLSLGAIATIVIFGSISAFALLAFSFVWLGRRRRSTAPSAEAESSLSFVDERDDSSFQFRPRRPLPRTLRKNPPQHRDQTDNNAGCPSLGDLSPSRRFSLPVLPSGFSRHSSFDPFGGGMAAAKTGGGDGSGGGGDGSGSSNTSPKDRTRTKVSWIDEDFLHGPRISSLQRDAAPSGWRRFRDSWPLRTFVSSSSGAPRPEEMQEVPDRDQPRADVLLARMGSGWYREPQWSDALEPMPLHGQTYTLTIPSSDAAPALLNRPPMHDDTPRQFHRPMTSPTRVGPRTGSNRARAARMRQSSADSTLSEILKSTERRLQEGVSSRVSRRNQAAWAPTKTVTTSREFLLTQNVSFTETGTPCKPNPKSCTPSPPRAGDAQTHEATHNNSPSHRRHASEPSVVAGSDRLYGGGGGHPADQNYGLIHAGRSTSIPPQHVGPPVAMTLAMAERRPSMSSSVSSALSTVYSEEEAQENTAMISTSPASSNIDDLHKTAMAQALSASDPFVSLPADRSNSPPRHHHWQQQRFGWQSATPSAMFPGVKHKRGESPRDKIRPYVPVELQRPEQLRRKDGSSGLTPPRRGPIRQKLTIAYELPAEEVTPRHNGNARRSDKEVSPLSNTPDAASLFAPSYASLESLLGSEQPTARFPNHGDSPHHHDLRMKHSSPTLGRAAEAIQLAIPPLPALPPPAVATSPAVVHTGTGPLDANPVELRDQSPPRSSSSPPNRINLNSGSELTRFVSNSSSSYSDQPAVNANHEASGSGREKAMQTRTDANDTGFALSVVIDGLAGPVPSPPRRRDTAAESRAGGLQVTSTVAELRRMNSQMSSYSVGSSCYSSYSGSGYSGQHYPAGGGGGGGGGGTATLPPSALRPADTNANANIDGRSGGLPLIAPSRSQASRNYLALGGGVKGPRGQKGGPRSGEGMDRRPSNRDWAGKKRTGTVTRWNGGGVGFGEGGLGLDAMVLGIRGGEGRGGEGEEGKENEVGTRAPKVNLG